jgi:hypothetical protein
MTHAQSTPAMSALAASIQPSLVAVATEYARPEKIPATAQRTALASTIPRVGTMPMDLPTVAPGTDLEATALATVTRTPTLALRPTKLAVSVEEAALLQEDLPAQLPCLLRTLLLRIPRRQTLLLRIHLPPILRRRRLHAILLPARMEGSVPTLAQAISATVLVPDILDLPVRMMSTSVPRVLTIVTRMPIVPTQLEATPAPVIRDTLAMVFHAPRLSAAPTKR